MEGSAPHIPAPEHTVPHSPMLLPLYPTATALPGGCMWLIPPLGITEQHSHPSLP